MRNVITNTTPILSLLKVNKLEILKDLYGKVIIPHAVYLEIEAGKQKTYYRDLSKIDWLVIKKIRDNNSRKYFFDLDDGEAEVLILAEELDADLVILDEIIGRRYAKILGYTLTGTLGILLKAKEKGIVTSLKELLNEALC